MSQIKLGAAIYVLFAQANGRSEYIGPAHSDSSKDLIILASASPSKSSQNNGARRTTVTTVRTKLVPKLGDPTCTVPMDISQKHYFSVPVGITEEDLLGEIAKDATLMSNANLVKAVFLRGQLIGLPDPV